MVGLDEIYEDSKVGIITVDPLLIKTYLDNKYIPYFLLFGDDSKSGIETCFVTLNPLDEKLVEAIRRNQSTQGFAYLRDGSEFSKYIKENTIGKVAEIFNANFSPEVMDDVAKHINFLPEEISKELRMYFLPEVEIK